MVAGIGLIAIGQCVDMGVLLEEGVRFEMKVKAAVSYVEQRLGAISPWESLVSDSQIFVFYELGTVNGHLLVFQVCVQSDQEYCRDSNVER